MGRRKVKTSQGSAQTVKRKRSNFNNNAPIDDDPNIWNGIDKKKTAGENLTRGRIALGFYNFIDLCELRVQHFPTHGQPTNFDNYESFREWQLAKTEAVEKGVKKGKNPKKIKKCLDDVWQRRIKVLTRFYTLLHQEGIQFINQLSLTTEERNQRHAFLNENLDHHFTAYTCMSDQH